MSRAVPGNQWDLLDGRTPGEAPRVSVVVLHHDQQAELDRTLHALSRQSHPGDRLQVVVADDGSPTAPRVPGGVEVVRQADEGFRAARARNLGAAATTGDVLCFLDADSTPEPQHVERISRLPALCPDAVVVGRRRHADLRGVPVDEPVEDAGPRHLLDEPGWLRDGYRASRDLLDADDRSYRYVIGATLACHRTLWTAAGGFDETSREYGGEDYEWAYRAWLHGAVLAHEPAAVVWHDGPDWAGRTAPEEQRARKLDETLRLAAVVPEPGTRPRGLRHGRADVLVRLPEGLDPSHAVIAVDGLLSALPDAVAVVPPEVRDAFPDDDRLVPGTDGLGTRVSHVRLEVDVLAPSRVEPEAWRAEVDGLAPDVGEVVWCDADGTPLLRLTAVRARRREERWPGERLFERERRSSAAVEAVPPGLSVAGWFARW